MFTRRSMLLQKVKGVSSLYILRAFQEVVLIFSAFFLSRQFAHEIYMEFSHRMV